MENKNRKYGKRIWFIWMFICVMLSFSACVQRISADDQSALFGNDEKRAQEQEKEETHIFLKSKGDGACHALTGDVVLTAIFVNDEESVWTEEEKQAIKNGHLEAIKLTEEAAMQYGVTLSIQTEYMDSKATGTFSIKEYDEWAEKVLKNAGLKKTKGANMKLEEQYQVQEAPILLYVNRSGRSFAVRYSGATGTEYAVLYREAIDFRHELYHLFGAEDFYYPEKVKEIAQKYFPDSIMASSEGTTVDELTAYLLGWTDTLSESANNFLEETKNMTEEELQEGSEEEWFTGEGTRRIGDATYTGQLVEGEAHGYGKMVWDSGTVYEGSWANNQPHGQGRMTWTDGTIYTGDFVKGVREGKGTLIWTTGTSYTGDFVNNQFHGQGTYIWESGTSYTGGWQDGKQHGEGTITFYDGTVQAGIWEQGELVQ